MSGPSHGDPRRPDGDLVSGVEPYDARVDKPVEPGAKVGWGHDAVYLPRAKDETVDEQDQPVAPPRDPDGLDQH